MQARAAVAIEPHMVAFQTIDVPRPTSQAGAAFDLILSRREPALGVTLDRE